MTQPSQPMLAKSILHVVSNAELNLESTRLSGLWISELTVAFDIFAAKGYRQRLVSPKGGKIPINPRLFACPLLDQSATTWLTDRDRVELLHSTARPDELSATDFDAICFNGGHAAMLDFPDDEALQNLTRGIWENGGVVSSVCHGYCGFLNTRLSNNRLLVDGRRLTGSSWIEEEVTGMALKVPFNCEEEMRQRGAIYQRGPVSFMRKVIVDGRLVTGQNAQSAKDTAEEVVRLLRRTMP